MELAKSFEPKVIESHWYSQWEQSGYFKAGLDPDKTDNFCILLPPPNVTGTLHMGHGFNQTLMDALTRYHRMRGDNTLWQPAPTTRVLPRKSLWNASSTDRASRATISVARNSSRRCGSGRNTPATRSPSRCAASVLRRIGRANASRWIPV